MWQAIVSYLPGWDVIAGAFFAFLIPYGIARLANWLGT